MHDTLHSIIIIIITVIIYDLLLWSVWCVEGK